ncbi:hypothetical protein [Enterobacter hormaechei]|uniref:hypothetical protein n=1 Tax=Enterobacter hormaechei TaxID=158836 RepID=UPI001BD2A331|nr:hypothetical protein [Enterobacter hormaechei]EHN8715627.1 hypothetical protein [Enterobacter hormaechei]MDO6166572.1 hypothetical protein [Enterobacter hormaechei]MDO6170603.1 hypothetical protein [Enterobacter hormaechei]
MSNIDKRALRKAAEKHGDDDILALLDELEAKDKQIADLKEAFRIALSAAGIDAPAAAGKGEAS